MPTENVNVTPEVKPQILPETPVMPLEAAAASGRADVVIGAAGAAVILLAAAELVHIGKWAYKKIKTFVEDKKVESNKKPEEKTDAE